MNNTQNTKIYKHLAELKKTPSSELKASQKETIDTHPATDVEPLLEAHRAGDKEATKSLLKAVDGTIDKAINAFAQGNKEYRTKAKVMALEAINSFDNTKGAKLDSYVYTNLQRLQRLSADRGNFIHMPEKSSLEKNRLEKIKRDFEIDNGYEPSLDDISDIAGMDIRKVGRLMHMKGAASDSQVSGESGDSMYKAPRTALSLYEDTLYQELDTPDKKIYEWSTGYQGTPKINREEMSRRLGISQAALSQRASKIDQLFASNGRTIEEVIYGRDKNYN